jgi:lysophospholipase L1-like esterase
MYKVWIIIFSVLLMKVIFACDEPQSKVNQKQDMKSIKSYLALGDSYTIGESVDEKDRWPVQLVKALNGKGYNYSSPKIIAKTGWTTDELKAAIEKEEIKDTFDLVSICIGVNNQYRGRDVENFRTEFKELLQMSIKFSGNKVENVFVLSIPDWGKTPFAEGRERDKIEKEIELYNKVKKEECHKANVAFVEITQLTQNLGDDSSLLAKDGLHYSGKMHQLWVDEVIRQYFYN